MRSAGKYRSGLAAGLLILTVGVGQSNAGALGQPSGAKRLTKPGTVDAASTRHHAKDLAWAYSPDQGRCAHRAWDAPDLRVFHTGFRTCRNAFPIIYVNESAHGAGDGTSWDNAYTDLQDALEDAATENCCVIGGCEIWVAAGTYQPDRGSGDRDATFQLLDCVALYGGFAGGETSHHERDWVANETILSGDLAGNDIPDLAAGLGCFTISGVSAPASCAAFDVDDDGDVDRDDLRTGENSYHVVTGSGVDGTAVLDGFTITGGSGEYTEGAGLYNLSGNPTVANCLFRANYDGADGGGVYNEGSSPTITDCTFIANRSGYNCGGAVANHDESNPVITSSLFIANWANSGGALYNTYSNPYVVNCAFYGNRCTWSWGGAMSTLCADHISMTNCVFSGNTSNSGGALDNVDSEVTLTDCTMVNNHIGNLNFAGGIRQFNGTLIVDNSILWGNRDSGGTDESAQITMTGGTPVVRYSCVEGCSTFCANPAYHNTGYNPVLLDADGPDDVAGTEDDDLRLSGFSPCIDAGNNTAVPADGADVDGDGDLDERTPQDVAGGLRFVDDCRIGDTGVPDMPNYPAVVDMGAYEYQPKDADEDGRVDLDDYGQFRVCLTGPDAGTLEVECEPMDSECDGDVDLLDLAEFQVAFTGTD